MEGRGRGWKKGGREEAVDGGREGERRLRMEVGREAAAAGCEP
jgi:hypothetical protein